MNVLFVSSGNKANKASIIIQNQAESLSKNGLEIDFFLIKGTGFIGYLKNVFPLISHLKRNHYDIIHSHYSFSAFISTIVLWRSQNTPHIVSLMGSDLKSSGIYKKLIALFSLYHWDKTIVKSQTMIEKINLSKLVILPNGVDVEKIMNLEKLYKPKNRERTSSMRPVILFAASPKSKVKNISLAINAMNLINRELTIVYNKSHQEILEELLDADVLLLTSKWEGSPNIVKEAMACNCPVVATDVGDVRWLFGNVEGYFIASFKPEVVAKKINQALDFAKKFGKTEGRERIFQLKLDSKNIANRLIEVYKEVLKDN